MDPQNKEGVWLSCMTLSLAGLGNRKGRRALCESLTYLLAKNILCFPLTNKRSYVTYGTIRVPNESKQLFWKGFSGPLSLHPGCRPCLLGHKTGYCCTRGLLYSQVTLYTNCRGIYSQSSAKHGQMQGFFFWCPWMRFAHPCEVAELQRFMNGCLGWCSFLTAWSQSPLKPKINHWKN